MFLALVGLAMITVRSFAVGPGTLLILTAAVLWALHLVALERWSRAGHLYGLTVIQLATSATVALGCQVLLDDWQGFCATDVGVRRSRHHFLSEPPLPAAPSSH